VGGASPESARAHLEQHLKKWRHPEAYVLLAELLVADGDAQRARELLQQLLDDMKWTTTYNYRLNRRWIGKAKRMLRALS
jgi:hypothetical protein